MTGERKTNDASFKRPRGVRAHKIMYPLSVDVNFRTEVKQIWIGCESDPIRLCTYPIHVNLVWTSAKCKGSSQKFAHRGQTKELSYGGGGGGGEGRGLDPIRCAIDIDEKKKLYNPQPSALWPLQMRANLKQVISWSWKGKQVHAKRHEGQACGCNRSIADIDWLLKARLKAQNSQWSWQALAPVRHCRSTPAAHFCFELA